MDRNLLLHLAILTTISVLIGVTVYLLTVVVPYGWCEAEYRALVVQAKQLMKQLTRGNLLLPDEQAIEELLIKRVVWKALCSHPTKNSTFLNHDAGVLP